MQVPPPELKPPAPRDEVIKNLSSKTYDVVIIGGGATGLGAAFEAIQRGLSVALVEKNDFGSGTSSRSTNMLHGGVRYLQNAIQNRKSKEMKLVKKGLKEEIYIYNSAPFMISAVPICVPVYRKAEKKRFGKILKKYDELASKANPFPEVSWSTRKQLLYHFPKLRLKDDAGNELLGGWIYYDGQQDDARMALLIALSAAEAGVDILNYCEVLDIQKDTNGLVNGLTCRDLVTSFDSAPDADIPTLSITSKVVINATGPFSDFIRKLDNPKVDSIIRPAAGTHVVLPAHFSPHSMGLVIMETTDGRVLFSLPWQGATLVGTTDRLVEVTELPVPSDEEITWIISELNHYLDKDLQARKEDILSAWCGIRPLAIGTQSLTGTGKGNNSTKKETKGITREHLIEVSDSNLISIAGGKWTTYHAMAVDVVDRAVSVGSLSVKPRKSMSLVGSDRSGAACDQKFELVVIKLKSYYRLPQNVAIQLQKSYGTRALHVAEMAVHGSRPDPVLSIGSDAMKANVLLFGIGSERVIQMREKQQLLHPEHTLLEAQIRFAVRHEMAQRAVDVLSRRTRLAQVDVLAASEVTERVIEIMAEELNWSDNRIVLETEFALKFLNTMSLDLVRRNVNTFMGA